MFTAAGARRLIGIIPSAHGWGVLSHLTKRAIIAPAAMAVQRRIRRPEGLTGVAFCATLLRMSKPLSLRAITPGQVVRQEFSLAEVAQACGIDKSTAWRWAQEPPRGTGGVVPARYHVDLLQLAHRLRRQLTPEDLVLGRHE